MITDEEIKKIVDKNQAVGLFGPELLPPSAGQLK